MQVAVHEHYHTIYVDLLEKAKVVHPASLFPKQNVEVIQLVEGVLVTLDLLEAVQNYALQRGT